MRKFISPTVVAMNIVRYVGDRVSESGKSVPQLTGAIDIIGSPSVELVNELIEELEERGLLRIGNSLKAFEGSSFMEVNLTLSGWDQYEAEKRGNFSANYGFIAMKFGDGDLDPFVHNVVKPATKEIGYELLDMRDVARAGIIDNIMRTQIRDAAFVLVDLTHDNAGAYWEAGYAEGLGKPVIYICEKGKFEEASTHFDTNHCTTIPWSKNDDERFRQELIATLRRSLEAAQ